MTTTIVAFVAVLGILIFFHELGHFLLARLFGVGVETFSLGMGPRLVGRTVGRTDYRISLVPFGGFCKMVGEEPGAEIDPADIPISYTHQHVLKRMAIAAAGPIFNILLAVILLFCLFQVTGLLIYTARVGSITEGRPAQASGMEAGDLILAIDGVSIETWDEMTRIISDHDGAGMVLTIQRGDQTLVKNVTPERVTSQNIFGEDVERNMIGIGIGDETFSLKLNVIEAFAESIRRTYTITKLTILSLVKLLQGTISAKTIGGPIMIAEMAGEQAKVGMASLVAFTALISINLAILNLFPIPVLDGGHLVFFTIELLMGRPLSLRIRENANQTGLLLLLVLMAFVLYNDIARIFARIFSS